MDLLNETILLKTKCTHFNRLIRETSQFLGCERLLNMTHVAYKKMHFPRNAILVALLYSGFISRTIKTISIQNSSRIPFGCKKCVFLHDTRLWFPDYMIFHENRLLADDSHEISYLIFFENWERCPKICRLLQS